MAWAAEVTGNAIARIAKIQRVFATIRLNLRFGERFSFILIPPMIMLQETGMAQHCRVIKPSVSLSVGIGLFVI
jgi:hypothetical protein